jgi:hypothetical protein
VAEGDEADMVLVCSGGREGDAEDRTEMSMWITVNLQLGENIRVQRVGSTLGRNILLVSPSRLIIYLINFVLGELVIYRYNDNTKAGNLST